MSSWIREEAYVENKFLEQIKALGCETIKITMLCVGTQRI